MKIHISYRFKDGPWGGGNQFLKALRREFVKNNIYTDSARKADVVLFDSYQNIRGLFSCWLRGGRQKIVYRLGPVFSLHRSGIKWKLIDRLVVLVANLCADLVIFQSTWSYQQALRLGFNKKKKHTIIVNAVDTSIFFRKQTIARDVTQPVRLIYTSWSSNLNKGFSYLKFLDTHLDFKKYEMRFIGNSPFSFKNIKVMSPLPSDALAEELRQSDIFISPVKDDACSNAILEGLAAGLPVVALESGGNGELVGRAGKMFQSEQGLLVAIAQVSANIQEYQAQIIHRSLIDAKEDYATVIRELYDSIK